jgi:amino acid adenylation domain-containing protein
VAGLARHLEQLLAAALAAPGTPVQHLDYLSKSDKHQLRAVFNAPLAPQPSGHTLTELFEEQAGAVPGRVAVVAGDTRLTYGQLNERANRLAHCLRDRYAIRPNDRVGIQLDKSAGLLVAVLGVLKAGGAYVPIDPGYPQDRIDYLVADSGCRLLIDEAALAQLDGQAAQYPAANPAPAATPADLAYVIYTSGSTGRPKGVRVTHGNVAGICGCWKDVYGLAAMPVSLLQLASISFDVFMGDLCRSLLVGGKLVLCPNDVKLDPPSLYDLMEAHGISILEGTPGLLLPLMEYVEQTGKPADFLKVLIFGSDALSLSSYFHLQEVFGGRMRIFNTYGTTETTIDSTYYEAQPGRETGRGITPIGKPFANTEILILDAHGQLLPVGVAGEICIAGPGVSAGYHDRPELTAGKFVPNPFRPGEKMYRTGDLGRWGADGNAEFIGRSDHQVKVRGYRIEPGEIESALQSHPSVETAHVLAHPAPDGALELVAYVTGRETPDPADLRGWLANRLPAYLVPAHFVALEALPLTPNGKLDRARLPEPTARAATAARLAPRTELEEKLLELWQEVLGHDAIGVQDNFFEIGGHSLKASRLVTRLNKQFDVNLRLLVLFNHPTIEGLASELEKVFWASNRLFTAADTEKISI